MLSLHDALPILPILWPALDVSMPTTRLELFVAVGPRRLNDPLAVALPVAPPSEASTYSENPSLTAVLVMLSAWVAAAPTCTLPKLTGSGVCALADSSR